MNRILGKASGLFSGFFFFKMPLRKYQIFKILPRVVQVRTLKIRIPWERIFRKQKVTRSLKMFTARKTASLSISEAPKFALRGSVWAPKQTLEYTIYLFSIFLNPACWHVTVLTARAQYSKFLIFVKCEYRESAIISSARNSEKAASQKSESDFMFFLAKR